jgi:hypothetical protein
VPDHERACRSSSSTSVGPCRVTRSRNRATASNSRNRAASASGGPSTSLVLVVSDPAAVSLGSSRASSAVSGQVRASASVGLRTLSKPHRAVVQARTPVWVQRRRRFRSRPVARCARSLHQSAWSFRYRPRRRPAQDACARSTPAPQPRADGTTRERGLRRSWRRFCTAAGRCTRSSGTACRVLAAARRFLAPHQSAPSTDPQGARHDRHL